MSRLFDPAALVLAGNHLIEASAGTGKTHAITNLFLRLLIEKKPVQEARFLSLRQIQVVTYTKAATAELRERIRRRIACAGRFFAGDEPGPPDSFLQELRLRCAQEGIGPRQAAAIFARALQEMDTASISTIHGFCQKILQSHAMDTDFPLDAETSPDESAFHLVALDDFWQGQAAQWPDVFHDHLASRGIQPDSLHQWLGRDIEKILVQGEDCLILPQALADDWPEILAHDTAALVEAWRSQGKEVTALLLSCNCLSQNKEKGYTPARIASFQDALDLFSSAPDRPLPMEALKALTPAAIAQNTLKKSKAHALEHPFFVRAEGIVSLFEGAEKHVVAQAVRHCLEAVPRLKRRARVLGFGDQITLLHRALTRPETGQRLAAQIRQEYPAALVDEFQDTDPVQYEIFSLIYPGDPDFFFCAIGDPKQSIYAFRGADIFSYLDAAAKTPAANRHTLLDNWRSEARLVAGVNALFGGCPRPFLFEDIRFLPASSPTETAVEPLVFADGRSPLSVSGIEYLSRKGDREFFMARHVAAHIAALLVEGRTGRATFAAADSNKSRPLAAGDIAVLVRTHNEGELLHRALQERKIRAVLNSRENVFASDEARDLDQLLAAVLNPRLQQGISRVLVSPLLGGEAHDLLQFVEDEVFFETTTEAFEELLTLWTRSGIVAMFSELCRKKNALTRLAGLVDGERRITNYRHLTELIQEKAHGAGLSPHEQRAWLGRLRAGAAAGQEEHLLRLASDRDLVRILTIHASKGLQFPVVFCPLFSRAKEKNLDTASLSAVFHDDNNRFRIDLGGAELAQHRQRARQERRAEDIRNFYVAITRAKNHCVILTFLSEDNDREKTAAPFSVLGHLLKKNDAAGIQTETCLETALAGLAQRHPESISFYRNEIPSAADDATGGSPVFFSAKARTFQKTLRMNWRLESFSSLAAAFSPSAPGLSSLAPSPTFADAEAEERDRDDFPDQDRSAQPATDFMHFPRGARAGNLMHAIMELMDFSSEDDHEKVISDCLARHGYDQIWVPALKDGLGTVLQTPLSAAPFFCLKDIPRCDRLNELEFYYPVPLTDHGRLAAYFSVPPAESNKTMANDARTFLKGYIDLVFRRENCFYLADYKSNFLGTQPGSYGQDALKREMAARGYDMQQRIYSLALHRFLRLRLGTDYEYDRHFGGVFYLFLRGMTPHNGPDDGVRFIRPERAEMEALDQLLDTQALRAS